MKNVLLIVNPKSGKGSIRSCLLDITDIFVKAGYDLTIYISQKRGDAREKVAKVGHFYDTVICSGGDGTLDEVISGMMQNEKKSPIGYIPSGSTNDFASSLGLPKNMRTAANKITEENAFPCDVGKMNDSYFVYVAAFGLFTDVSYDTPQDLKNALGHLAYVLKGVEALTAVKSFHLKVKADNLEIEDDFIYGMVTNSTSVGGFKNITGKNVKLDDGVFEVTLLRMPKNLIELNATLTALIKMKPDNKYMYQFRSARVEFLSDKTMPWTRDGEYGGEYEDVVITNEKQAMTLYV